MPKCYWLDSIAESSGSSSKVNIKLVASRLIAIETLQDYNKMWVYVDLLLRINILWPCDNKA